jgi:hypothetical protein
MEFWSDKSMIIRYIVLITTTLGMGYVLFLNWKMIKFTKQYSEKWSSAFKVLMAAMVGILARRCIGIIWGIGHWPDLEHLLEWVDYVVMATYFTICYVIFFHLEWKWWNDFWEKYKIEETTVSKVIVEDANHVEVKEPKKVEVDLNGKTVLVEKPVKVLVERPKKLEVIKAKGNGK